MTLFFAFVVAVVGSAFCLNVHVHIDTVMK